MKKVIDKVIFFGGWSVLAAYFAAGAVLTAGMFGFEPAQQLMLWAVS